MPSINIKKYSRSNIDNPSAEIPSQDIDNNLLSKKSRGRPKRAVQPESVFEPVKPEEPTPLHEENIITNEESEEPFIDLEASETFLEELNANNYKEPPTEQEKKAIEKSFKESTKQNNKKIKFNEKIQEKVNSVYESSDLFDDKGSEIIGRDRRVIINKLNQYRNLFPKELSKFKVKKGASVEELKAFLDEMGTIVETSTYDNFLTDSIIEAIKLAEGASKYTRHDITGCADMLKANPQFNALMKQMYLKYNVFNKIPIEIQLLLLVTSTAYICTNKNKNKAHLESYLNEPMKS
jgi:hypothetical protein